MLNVDNFCIRKCSFIPTAMLAALLAVINLSFAQIPDKDLRAERLIDADHFELRFKHADTREEWEARKKEIREKFLLYSGLWPPPVKCALNPKMQADQR